jgi:hypothetical protein
MLSYPSSQPAAPATRSIESATTAANRLRAGMQRSAVSAITRQSVVVNAVAIRAAANIDP